jgi:protein-disulfide isomerase
LVEFADFECPYCAQFDQLVLPSLKQEFVDTGVLAFVYRDFPLPKHKYALRASSAAACAIPRGKYWQMHTQLFARQGQFRDDQLIVLAGELGLDAAAFRACLSSEATLKMQADQALGRALGVSVTPTFFVGQIVSDGDIDIKWKLLGAQPVDAFRAAINRVRADTQAANK